MMVILPMILLPFTKVGSAVVIVVEGVLMGISLWVMDVEPSKGGEWLADRLPE